jgi:hypothetical protein
MSGAQHTKNHRQDARMIFAQHRNSSFVDAAQSAGRMAAEGVLLLGRLGQGVGLLSDVLAAAALESGLPAICEELHGFAPLHPLSGAAIWLGTSEAPSALAGSDVSLFDVVVALDRAAISVAYRLVKPNGRILLPLADEMHSGEERFGAAAGLHSVLFRSQQVSIGYLAGCLSGCVSMPDRAWRAALNAHLRPRDRRTAQAQFAAGRREFATPRMSWR